MVYFLHGEIIRKRPSTDSRRTARRPAAHLWFLLPPLRLGMAAKGPHPEALPEVPIIALGHPTRKPAGHEAGIIGNEVSGIKKKAALLRERDPKKEETT